METAAAQLVEQVLAEAGRACLTCSFQAEDVVVLDLARRVRPDLPILFLETGYHFPETLAFRDRLASEWNLNLRNLAAANSVAAQETEFGQLYTTTPTQCCQLRKVEPLLAGLADYDVWLTGLRREQSPTRANLQPIEEHRLPIGHVLQKVSPLAMWTNADVWRYSREHGLPLLSLYDEGYTSIGCAPCTQKPLSPDDLRSGRWAGQGKRECGIHTFSQSA